MSLSPAPPALRVAMSHTSCGMGMRRNGPPVCARTAGLPKVPVYENERRVLVSVSWTAEASPVDQLHISSGARSPRGHTVPS